MENEIKKPEIEQIQKTKPELDDVWGDSENIKQVSNQGQKNDNVNNDVKSIDDIFDNVINHYEESALDKANKLKHTNNKQSKK